MWIISQRKKALIDNLTSIMKSAAVDCPLSFNENKDGTFQCSLFKNTGDFMYHPLIGYDIERVREEFGEGVVMSEAQKAALAAAATAAAPVAAKAATVAAAPAKAASADAAVPIRKAKIKGIPYVFVPVMDGGIVTVFNIFADDGTGKPTGKKVGEVDAEDGKPKAGTAKFYKV